MNLLYILAIILVGTFSLFLIIDRICKCAEHCSTQRALSDAYQAGVNNGIDFMDEKKEE